jgi:chromosome segregation ATPase
MERGKMSIPSSSDESSSDDEGEGNPSIDELAEAVKFFQDVCTKQKAQLKNLKNKLISSQNDYKCLLEKFETFANLKCELSTKIEQLKSSATSTATEDSLIKKNEKLKAKLASSQDVIENLLSLRPQATHWPRSSHSHDDDGLPRQGLVYGLRPHSCQGGDTAG